MCRVNNACIFGEMLSKLCGEAIVFMNVRKTTCGNCALSTIIHSNFSISESAAAVANVRGPIGELTVDGTPIMCVLMCKYFTMY